MKKKVLYLIAAGVAALLAVSSCSPELPPDPSALSAEVDNGGAVGAEGGVVNIKVTSNVAWTVSKADADTWITLGADKGENNGVLEVSFEANPESLGREAVITFKSESIGNPVTVTIKQAAATETPPDPSVLSVEVDGDGAVGAEGGVVNIKVTSNVAWTVSKAETDTWVTLGADKGENDGVVEVSFEANPELSEREAVITFKSESIDNPITVTIKQAYYDDAEIREVTNFTDAMVIYYGNEWGLDTENWYAGLCFDGAALDYDGVIRGPGAYMILDLHAELGSGKQYIPNGTYIVGEADVPGAVGIGSSMFVDLDEDTRCRLASGTVTVTRSDLVYKITFNIKTALGTRLMGTYEGSLKYIDDSTQARRSSQNPSGYEGVANILKKSYR